MRLILPALLVSAFTLQQPGPTAQFKSSIDLVQVDVSVIDGEGRPIRGLDAEDFDLRVDGKARSITSAQFISVDQLVQDPASVSRAYYSSNAGTAGGRLIMIVVDSRSITAGRGKDVMEAAGRFLERLNPADRVALASVPRGPQIDFTADHALVRRLLQQVVGNAAAPLGLRNIGISDALAFERRDDAATDRIIERECGVAAAPEQRGAGNSEFVICKQQVRLEASQVAADARHRARESITSLRALLERLPPSSVPKVLVFITEGLVTEHESTQLSWLEAKAASQHVTIYALHIQQPEYEASKRRPSQTYAADRAALEEGLYLMTQATRGDVFRVISNSDFAFQRLRHELSGYYLLGFEPEPGERNGRPHKIQVTTRRRGVTIRSRRQFTIGPILVKTPAGEITALLRDPLPASEIPIGVTTYAFRDPHSEKIRLLIVADIERPINSGQLSVGYVLVDFNRRLAAQRLDATLPSNMPRDGRIQRYFSTAVVDRAKYTLKLAAVNESGLRGTVERVVTAQLNVAGPVRVTDLLIGEGASETRRMPATPTVSGIVKESILDAYVELYAQTPGTLDSTTVALEVGETEGSPALRGADMPLHTTSEDNSCRIAGGAVNVADLEPGDYVARAVISIAGRRVGQVTRPFTIAPH